MNRINAFRHFAVFDGPTQSRRHIKPLHDYVTSRLVLEGGFHPDQLVPRPRLTWCKQPSRIFGYLFVIRANRAGDGAASTDVVIDDQGRPVEAIVRFHYALRAMTDRVGIRNDLSRYEAVAMAMVDMYPGRTGELMENYPPEDSQSTSNGSFRRCMDVTMSDMS